MVAMGGSESTCQGTRGCTNSVFVSLGAAVLAESRAQHDVHLVQGSGMQPWPRVSADVRAKRNAADMCLTTKVLGRVSYACELCADHLQSANISSLLRQ